MSVKVIQEPLPNSQMGLEIEVPGEMSQKTYDQVLREMMQSVSIPGFRRGKVPQQVFLQRMGANQVKAAVLEKLVQKAIDTAIEQEEIDALGNYQLTSGFEDLLAQFIPGQVLTVKASVDVPPRVSLPTYTGLTLQAEEVVYDASKVDEIIDRQRASRATLVPVEERPAQTDDVAIIDFLGQIKQEDGTLEPFEGGEATDFELDLKPSGFIPGFVEGIIGMELEETKDVEAQFPEDYAAEALAGKTAVFTITLKELKEKELPDLDNDFAQDVSEFDTLEELRQSLEEQYQEDAQEKTTDNQREAILTALVAALEVEIPETLVMREVNHLVYQAVTQLARQGIDVNKFITQELLEGMRDRTRPDAIARLQRTLALGEVAKQESITIDDAEVQTRMKEMLEEVQDPQAVDQERLREVVTEEVLQGQILDWLLAHNTVTLVPPGTLSAPEADEAEAEAEGTAAEATVEVAATEVAATAVEPAAEPVAEEPTPEPPPVTE